MTDKNSIDGLCNAFVEFVNTTNKFSATPYVIRQENEGVIKKLVLYFMAHPESKLDPKKGIYLYGPVGTGKTTLIRLLGAWLNKSGKHSFSFISCRDIQQEFAQGGYKELLKYTKKSYRMKNNFRLPENGAIVYCFDDFGSEGASMFYGNKVNVMEEVLQDRYREYEDFGMITHMTSNLKPNTTLMSERYTYRVSDRINGMFNLLELQGGSFRK